MAIISKDSLPDASTTLPRESVSLKEYGIDGEVYVRALTAHEEKQAMKYGKAEDAELNAYVASVAAVDDNGDPVFSLKYMHGAFGKMARHLTQVAMKLSGMLEDDEDESAEGKD